MMLSREFSALTCQCRLVDQRFSPLGPVGIVIFLHRSTGNVSTRKIVKIWLVSFFTIFLLRNFKPQRP
jgi:hypothetical protein